MALFDVIRFNGLASRDWLIYKYPSDDISHFSQLIVQEGQIAVFLKGGTICDIFGPGSYSLSTDNLPILKNLVKIPFGGKTPSSAEIYFINTTIRFDINWGTSDPIQLIDPKYHVKLRIRAFGQMGVKVLDPVLLMQDLIGGMPLMDIVKFDKVREYYRGLLVLRVKSAIADSIISKQISALEISPLLSSLSENVKAELAPEFEKHGFSVHSFYIHSVNFPDNDFEKINSLLEDRAAFEIMGDQRYLTKRAFDVYDKAAGNKSGVAGAFAASGIGLGTALHIGNSLQHTVGNPLNQVAKSQMHCPSCGAEIPASSKFCPECGFRTQERTCSCGFKLLPGNKFCPECGKKSDTIDEKDH